MAISVKPQRGRGSSSGSPTPASHEVHRDVSVPFREPHGARIQDIADPPGEMYGHTVL